MGVGKNLYLTVTEFQSRLGITAGTSDSLIESLLQAASRDIDADAHRHFFSETKILYPDTLSGRDLLLPDDLLSVSAFAVDSEVDGTWDGETWAEGTDYVLLPDAAYPKTRIAGLGWADYAWATGRRYLKITGAWGYGDGERAAPWDATSVTGTVATVAGTSLTISVSAGLERGQTILIGSEQMYVSAVVTTTATVIRGVNGTTAAAHTGAAISTAAYPAIIQLNCFERARDAYLGIQDRGDIEEEQLGPMRNRYRLTARKDYADRIQMFRRVTL